MAALQAGRARMPHKNRASNRTIEALRRTNQTLLALVRASPLAIVALDRDGAVTIWSPAAERLFGWRADEVLGRPQPIVPPRMHLEFDELRRRVLGGESLTAVQAQLQRKDGSPVDVSVSAAPLSDGNGAGSGLISLVMDVTEQKRLDAQLRQAQKMEAIGRLAGGIAHDFNNQLSVVLGYAEMLIAEADEGPLKEDLEEIRKAGQSAAALTQQLLAFSRKQVQRPAVLDLSAIVRNLEKMVRHAVGEDVEVATSLDPALGRVRADPGHIEQVLLDLVLNARDAMVEGGRLTMATENVELNETRYDAGVAVPPGRYVVLSVGDTGVGIGADEQAHLFEPFYTTKELGKGIGLGLATAYGIVKQSGGWIAVESEPGRGTVFRIYLPVVDEGVDVAPAAPALTPRAGRETILLAEDAPAVLKLACAALRRHGYHVLEARNAEEALVVAGSHTGPIDLLVTDVVMPGASGPELAKRLCGSRPQTRVLYMSGYAEKVLADRGVLHAGITLLQKPFTPTQLLQQVREVLDRPGSAA